MFSEKSRMFVCVSALAMITALAAGAVNAETLSYTTGLEVWLSSLDVNGQLNVGLSDNTSLDSWVNRVTGSAAGNAITNTGTAGKSPVKPVFKATGGPTSGPAVWFDNSDNQHYSSMAFNEFMDTDTFTIFAKVYHTGGQGDVHPLFWDYGAGSQMMYMGALANASKVRDSNADVIDSTAGAPFESWNAGLMCLSKSGDAFTLETGRIGSIVSNTNAAYDSTTWEGTAFAPTVASYPTGGNGHGFGGYIAEMLIYDHAVTGDDRAAVIAYLNSPVIPEPGTLALLATGLISLLCYAWRKRK